MGSANLERNAACMLPALRPSVASAVFRGLQAAVKYREAIKFS